MLLLFLRWVYAPIALCLLFFLNCFLGLPCALCHSIRDPFCIDILPLLFYGRVATLQCGFSAAAICQAINELPEVFFWLSLVSLSVPCVLFLAADQLGPFPSQILLTAPKLPGPVSLYHARE